MPSESAVGQDSAPGSLLSNGRARSPVRKWPCRRHGARPELRERCRCCGKGELIMRYIQLGERGPQVSRIAFGNWSAGGDWGQVDRDAAISATRAALELGITLFDTAHAYGFGVAEQLLGEALQPEIQRARESLVIATKGGLRNDHGFTVRDSSPTALRRDLE